MKYTFKQGGWQDESGYDSFVYYYIVDEDNKKVWESMWMDIRDLGQKEMDDLFRCNINRGCGMYGLKQLSEDQKDHWEWEDIINDTGQEQEDV